MQFVDTSNAFAPYDNTPIQGFGSFGEEPPPLDPQIANAINTGTHVDCMGGEENCYRRFSKERAAQIMEMLGFMKYFPLAVRNEQGELVESQTQAKLLPAISGQQEPYEDRVSGKGWVKQKVAEGLCVWGPLSLLFIPSHTPDGEWILGAHPPTAKFSPDLFGGYGSALLADPRNNVFTVAGVSASPLVWGLALAGAGVVTYFGYSYLKKRG